MRNNSTRDFLTAWEQLNNSAAFKEPNFDLINMSPTKWVECTGASWVALYLFAVEVLKVVSGQKRADIAIEFMGYLSSRDSFSFSRFANYREATKRRCRRSQASSKITNDELLERATNAG